MNDSSLSVMSRKGLFLFSILSGRRQEKESPKPGSSISGRTAVYPKRVSNHFWKEKDHEDYIERRLGERVRTGDVGA